MIAGYSWYFSQGEQYIIWADVAGDKLNLAVGPKDVDPTVFPDAPSSLGLKYW